jgi:hypothetical protein
VRRALSYVKIVYTMRYDSFNVLSGKKYVFNPYIKLTYNISMQEVCDVFVDENRVIFILEPDIMDV